MTAVLCDQNKEGSAWCGSTDILSVFSESRTELDKAFVNIDHDCAQLLLKVITENIRAGYCSLAFK
jgi:hypothetical protein